MITYTLKRNDGMGKCCSGAAGKLLSSFIAGECLPQETQGGEDFSSENNPAVDDCCRQLASGMIVLSFTWTTILRRSARSRQKYTLCKRRRYMETQRDIAEFYGATDRLDFTTWRAEVFRMRPSMYGGLIPYSEARYKCVSRKRSLSRSSAP